MQDVTEQTVAAISNIVQIAEEIDTLSTTIATSVEEQAAATNEIAENIQQVTDGTRDVATRINEVSREAGDVGELSHEISTVTGQLSGDVSDLKGRIVHLVRAASFTLCAQLRPKPIVENNMCRCPMIVAAAGAVDLMI